MRSAAARVRALLTNSMFTFFEEEEGPQINLNTKDQSCTARDSANCFKEPPQAD